MTQRPYIEAKGDLHGITAGTVYTIGYPFIRAKFSSYDVDTWTWKPGVGHRLVVPDDSEAYANGMGKMVLTVLSIHKPGGGFPTRVFFTRKFIAPDGHAFGKRKCHIMTLGAFRARTRGFMHPFVVDENEREAA